MVNIGRTPYMNGWSYEIITYVPKQWISDKLKGIAGHGFCGLCTGYSDHVRISLNENDPELKEHLTYIISICVEKEDEAINKINSKIVKLHEEKEELIIKTRSKFGRDY